MLLEIQKTKGLEFFNEESNHKSFHLKSDIEDAIKIKKAEFNKKKANLDLEIERKARELFK